MYWPTAEVLRGMSKERFEPFTVAQVPVLTHGLNRDRAVGQNRARDAGRGDGQAEGWTHIAGPGGPGRGTGRDPSGSTFHRPQKYITSDIVSIAPLQNARMLIHTSRREWRCAVRASMNFPR